MTAGCAKVPFTDEKEKYIYKLACRGLNSAYVTRKYSDDYFCVYIKILLVLKSKLSLTRLAWNIVLAWSETAQLGLGSP